MKRKKPIHIQITTLAISAFLSSTAYAGPASEALGACFIQSTSGRDRDTLVKWLFYTMSMNPRIKDIVNSTPTEREKYTKLTASLYDRLVFVDCKQETLIAIREDGAESLVKSFKMLGEMAAVELMTDPAVAKESSELNKYVDAKKWGELVSGVGK